MSLPVPYYQNGGITIYHGDCREVCPLLPSVGMVVTDPPYVFGIASTFEEGKAGGWGDLMNSAGIYAGWLKTWAYLLLIPHEQRADGPTCLMRRPRQGRERPPRIEDPCRAVRIAEKVRPGLEPPGVDAGTVH